MSLNTGHPEVEVIGTPYGGDADEGLREYLVSAFGLPSQALDESNGSELIIDGPVAVGAVVTATFYLYWGNIVTATFAMSGKVVTDPEDPTFTILEVDPSTITRQA